MPSWQGSSQTEKNWFSSPGVRWLSSWGASLWAGRDKRPRGPPAWRLFTAGSKGRRVDAHRRNGGGEQGAIDVLAGQWVINSNPIRRGCWLHSEHLPNRAVTSPWPFVMKEASLGPASVCLQAKRHNCALWVLSSVISTFHYTVHRTVRKESIFTMMEWNVLLGLNHSKSFVLNLEKTNSMVALHF